MQGRERKRYLHVVGEKEERSTLSRSTHNTKRVGTIRLRVAQGDHVVSRVNTENTAELPEDLRSVVLEGEGGTIVRRSEGGAGSGELELDFLLKTLKVGFDPVCLMGIHADHDANTILQPACHVPRLVALFVDYLSHFVELVNGQVVRCLCAHALA